MKNKVLLILALIFGVGSPMVTGANTVNRFQGRVIESVTGIIQKIGRNSIEIIDEQDRLRKKFVYLGNIQFHPGERVRIYYRVQDKFIEDILRMTPVKAAPANRGYF